MPIRRRPTHRQRAPAPPRSRHDDLRVDIQGPEQTLPVSWSSEAYARWFFGFLRTDLTTLTPGQLRGMSDDMWAFVRPDILVDTSLADQELLPATALEALQRDARAGIQRVREGQWFHLEKGIGYGIALDGDRIIKGVKSGTFEDQYRAAVMDTVQACWDRLRSCPRCQAIFVKVGKQKYCSPTCANRAAWDAFKGRGRPRDYRREYARRTQKRLGPNAKVKIKPRGSK